MRAINQAIYAQLAASTAVTSLLSGTTAIYHIQAPEGAVYPYIVYSKNAGSPDNLTPSDSREQVMFVRAYSDSDTPQQACNIDDKIELALHKKNLSVTGYTNVSTLREQEFENTENKPTGEIVFMAGAYYRIKIDN